MSRIKTVKLNSNRIFYKFDEDGSNTLEVEEFLSMFKENYLIPYIEVLEEDKQNKILFDLESDFKKLYSFVSTNEKLTLEQFVNLALNEKAISFFQKSMKKVTSNQLDKKFKIISSNEKNFFIPNSFDRMIEFLSYKAIT